jgi:3-hydroxyisobutyrate dehydrogenase-like beta-hydroxyacid dehydrogenase
MAMGNELINAGGPGMGIRVKLINNYMSIALNALSLKPPCCAKRSASPSTWRSKS